MTILGHQLHAPKLKFIFLYLTVIVAAFIPAILWGGSFQHQQIFNFVTALSTGALCTMSGVRPTEKFGIPIVVAICLVVGVITQGSYYLVFF